MDVIAFFDGVAEQSRTAPCIILLDNANTEAMEMKRDQWQQSGLYMYYLPPYSPELNRIEICGSSPNTSGASSHD
jgi:transposase